MSSIKYLQLVEHSIPFHHYALHEALMEIGLNTPYWIGSKALRKYNTYTEAIEAWGKLDKASSNVDILYADDIIDLFEMLEYTDETELNFDD